VSLIDDPAVINGMTVKALNDQLKLYRPHVKNMPLKSKMLVKHMKISALLQD